MRIAVCDESSLVLDLLREALEGAGFAVTCARDACPPLIARYRPRFQTLARRRLSRAVDLFDDAREGGLAELVRELHRLAGEAQLS